MPDRYKPTKVEPIPIELFKPLLEAWQDMVYYTSQMASGFQIKVPLAMVASFYTHYLGGDWVLLAAFLFLDFLDLVLGTCNAVRSRTFSMIRMRKWVIKLLTYGATIVVVGILDLGFYRASSYNAPILEFFLLVLITTEAMSIFTHMGSLNWPVPAVAIKLARRVHDKANAKLDEVTEPQSALEAPELSEDEGSDDDSIQN